METDGGGWTVIQRRMDGSVGFYRNWNDYEQGFGDVYGEYWLGLSKIYRLANDAARQQLRVDLGDFSGNTAYAKYVNFYIGGYSTSYTLYVTGYDGTAGDSMAYHNCLKFSTYDNDNDLDMDNCAEDWKGGWWYKDCYEANLNGKYVVGDVIDFEAVVWASWKDEYTACKYADMKIRDISEDQKTKQLPICDSMR